MTVKTVMGDVREKGIRSWRILLHLIRKRRGKDVPLAMHDRRYCTQHDAGARNMPLHKTYHGVCHPGKREHVDVKKYFQRQSTRRVDAYGGPLSGPREIARGVICRLGGCIEPLIHYSIPTDHRSSQVGLYCNCCQRSSLSLA